MTTIPEPRCELTELIASQCAHCLGHVSEIPDETQLTVDDIGPRFAARYSSPCSICRRTIAAGETIAALNDRYGYACAGCLP